MKISGRVQILSDYSMDKAIEMMKNFGFEGLEMSFLTKNFQFKADMIEPFYIEHTVETAKKFDMPILSTSCHGDYLYDDKRFEDVKKAVVATPLYGANICIISNANKPIYCDEKDWELFINRTREIVELAEKNSVTIALEFEPAMVCGTTAQLLKAMETIKSDNFKANLDLGHVFLCDPEPMEAIKSLKGKIAHSHIENMGRGVHRHLPPYMGDMDLFEYTRTLRETGFDGTVALDLYQDDFVDIASDCATWLKDMVKKLEEECPIS